VRLEFHIPVVITSTEAISAEIAKNRYFINEVAPRHNLKVLGLLGFDLLRGTEATLLNTGPFTVTSKYGGGVNQYMHTWLDRALMIADYYRDNIAAYEILNEQNRLPPSGAAIQPVIMARLLTKFYRFCKNIDPSDENHGCSNTKIILGGIHPRGTSSPSIITDADYIRRTYDITNTLSSPSPFNDFKSRFPTVGYPVDGIAYHPYPEEIRLSPNNVEVDRGLLRMRQALEVVGDPFKPFWVTEVGYNVGFDFDGPANPRPPQTEAGQAAFMLDVYTTLSARLLSNSQPEVANVFWFKYEDFPPATGPNAQQWGIVRIEMPDGNCEGGCYDPSGKPLFYRQSFWTYRELAGLPVYRFYLSTIGKS
jgi:hypothetical protein